MSNELENITQKPRIADKRILPNDYLYLIRAGADQHARGADFAQSVVTITEDYALPVDTNAIGTILRVDATTAAVDLTLAAAASSYMPARLVVIKVDATANEVDCFGVKTLAKQGHAVEVAITSAGAVLLVDFHPPASPAVTLLDVASTNLAANTVIITGPAFVETTDGKTYKVPGGITTGTGGDNTKFREALVADENGDFVANFEVADSTGLVLGENVLGHVGGELRIGDGVTTGGVAVDGELPSTILETVSGALVGGDKTGNARGGGAIDIQVSRDAVTKVASGPDSLTIGKNATAAGNSDISIGKGASTSSGHYVNIAVGLGASCSGTYGIAIGYNTECSGTDDNGSVSIGKNASSDGAGAVSLGAGTVSAYGSVAVGRGASTGFGYYSFAIGPNVKHTFLGVGGEIGTWGYTNTRLASARMHQNGQVALTIVDSASAPTDGGATEGAEADGTLPRGMFAIQKNGTAVTLYYNTGTGIQSLALGTLS